MSAVPSSIATTIRGKAALDEVRELLDHLATVDADIETCDEYPMLTRPVDAPPSPMSWVTIAGIEITHDELRGVVQRRRDNITNKLQNKGIRIAPDPEPAHASLALDCNGVAAPILSGASA